MGSRRLPSLVGMRNNLRLNSGSGWFPGQRSRWAVIFSLCVILSSARAQFHHREALAIALTESCYQFNFSRADSLLAVIRRQPSAISPAEADLLEANLIWWKTISGDPNKSLKSRFNQVLESSRKNFRKDRDRTVGNSIHQLCIQGFKTRMAMLHQSKVSGFLQLNSSLKVFHHLLGKEQENPVLLIFNGLYHYYWAHGWDNHFLLRPYLALYPKGNLKLGLHLLDKATRCGIKSIETEAHYFLMRIFLDDRKPAHAFLHGKHLCRNYPQNPVFGYFMASILRNLGEEEKASEWEKKLLDALKRNPDMSAGQIQHFKQLCQRNQNSVTRE